MHRGKLRTPFGKKEVWKGILEKLRVLTETYPRINEKIREQWEILEEIMKCEVIK